MGLRTICITNGTVRVCVFSTHSPEISQVCKSTPQLNKNGDSLAWWQVLLGHPKQQNKNQCSTLLPQTTRFLLPSWISLEARSWQVANTGKLVILLPQPPLQLGLQVPQLYISKQLRSLLLLPASDMNINFEVTQQQYKISDQKSHSARVIMLLTFSMRQSKASNIPRLHLVTLPNSPQLIRYRNQTGMGTKIR